MTMFANVPDVTCLAPASGEQMLDMLAWATGPSEHGVVAIRIARRADFSHLNVPPIWRSTVAACRRA